MNKRLLVFSTALILALLPLSVFAQLAPLILVNANGTINVHRGPNLADPVVGSLEVGMPAHIFSCNSDCTWLEMGPSVWIESSGVTLITSYSSTVQLPTSVPALLPEATKTPIPTSTAIATLTPTPTMTPSATVTIVAFDCSHDAYNCSDFTTQSQATQVLNFCRNLGFGDIHKLDNDNDGVACEDLPQ